MRVCGSSAGAGNCGKPIHGAPCAFRRAGNRNGEGMERKGKRLEALPDIPGSRAHDANTADAVAAMEVRLHDLGPKGALEFLNARTRYRFTGIYHAEPPLLRNLFLFDRENPSLHV